MNQEFEKDIELIKMDIQRLVLNHRLRDDKVIEHLGHTIGLLDHVARKHNPKPKVATAEKVTFT